MGHLPIQRVLHMGYLNSVSDPGDGNLTAENKKIQMPGGGGEGDVDVTN